MTRIATAVEDATSQSYELLFEGHLTAVGPEIEPHLGMKATDEAHDDRLHTARIARHSRHKYMCAADGITIGKSRRH